MNGLRRRLQILLSDQQYELLEDLSRKQHCSIAELIRRAIESAYFPSYSYRALLALKKLANTCLLDQEQWQQIADKRKQT